MLQCVEVYTAPARPTLPSSDGNTRWCVAVYCSVVLCVALFGRVLRWGAGLVVRWSVWRLSAFHHVYCSAVYCSVLQCVAVCCSVVQCVAVCGASMPFIMPSSNDDASSIVLQCVAVCCSVLQCVAVCCSVLQCVAVRCSVLQCVKSYCNVL